MIKLVGLLKNHLHEEAKSHTFCISNPITLLGQAQFNSSMSVDGNPSYYKVKAT